MATLYRLTCGYLSSICQEFDRRGPGQYLQAHGISDDFSNQSADDLAEQLIVIDEEIEGLEKPDGGRESTGLQRMEMLDIDGVLLPVPLLLECLRDIRRSLLERQERLVSLAIMLEIKDASRLSSTLRYRRSM
ncbi:hypothetical protein ABIA39_002644 [Nocardia sp. GAS34]|uniref:hypothetical protein n=1 Tax=unclassified Nocardia TaxID=2637762 RepID=UPI003D1A292E